MTTPPRRSRRGWSRPPRPSRRGWSNNRTYSPLIRPASLWAAATIAITLSLSAPTLALAQGSGTLSPGTGNPLSPGLPQSQTPTPTAPATTTPATPNTSTSVVTNTGSNSSSGGGFTGTDAAVIAVGAMIVLGGISFFIWRDSRRRAPLRRAAAVTAGAGGRSRTGSKPPPKPRKLSPAERRRRKRGRAR